MKVGIVTLGCDKNTVDSERYLAQLAAYGAEATHDMELADIIIVNTCGFIDAAKKESIDALVEAGELKRGGRAQAVVAVGCMVQRHRDELTEALPEVDAFLGASDGDRLVETLVNIGVDLGERMLEHPGVRLYTGDLPHVRYLKISEGCDHGCSFCAIPLMRGRHRSFAMDDVVREAALLEVQGAREINLVAQDLAHYGRDMRDVRVGLSDLLERLLAETDVPWYRLLYLYSAGVTPRLLETMASSSRIVPYLDIPMQHASDTVLKAMRRPERAATIREKVRQARAAVPGLAIRTTCIVGYPGETEDDFEFLLDFLEETQIERVGVFTYSPQEGTRAASLADDVPHELKLERMERLSDLQRVITAERYEARLGKHASAIVDRIDEDTGFSLARMACQADDIDGLTYVDSTHAPGTIVSVLPTAVRDDYDFEAIVTRVESAVPVASARRRSLPLASDSTISAFGR